MRPEPHLRWYEHAAVGVVNLLVAMTSWGQTVDAVIDPSITMASAAEECLVISLPGASQQLARTPPRLPLSFVPNQGQAGTDTKFEARGSGYLLWLEAAQAVMLLAAGQTDAERGGMLRHSGALPLSPGDAEGCESVDRGSRKAAGDRRNAPGPGDDPTPDFRLLRMRLVGAYPDAEITGEELLPGKFHFFIGNDPSRWRTNVPSFARVRYREVYPGVDLVYYGVDGQLEYDFVVAPGADPSRIRLALEGADQAEVTENGDLRLVVADQELRWRAPVLFQESNGVRVPVPGGFVVDPDAVQGDGPPVYRVTFLVAPCDPTLALVIDPVLAFSTYLGGGLSDSARAVAVDSIGCAHVTGGTWSQKNFPTTSNALQRSFHVNAAAFVTKFDAAGSNLVYSTLLTGNDGEFGGSSGVGIAVDGQGHAVVVGATSTADFPTTSALQHQLAGDNDLFLAKLGADGATLVFSTFLGGSDYDRATGLTLDILDDIYVAGGTRSRDFPVTNALQSELTSEDGNPFVSRIASDGSSLVYSTYLSGPEESFFAVGVAVDASRRAHVAWTTSRSTSPDTWESDVTVVRLSADGSSLELAKSGFLRRPPAPATPLVNVDISVKTLAVDRGGAVYLAGETSSPDLLTTATAFQGTFAGGGWDTFVAKLGTEAMSLEYLTYVGGAHGAESPSAIVVDADGNAFVAGQTSSPDFPTADPIRPKLDGGLTPREPRDGFVLKLGPDGSRLIWSTFLGGGREGPNGFGNDEATGIALAPDGGAWVVGGTSSSDFPVAHPFQRSLKTEANWLARDAFVVKIIDGPVSPAALRIIRAGNQVTLSWPVTAAGYGLEFSEAITPVVNWGPEATAPAVVGDQNVVTLEIGAWTRFFRLMKP